MKRYTVAAVRNHLAEALDYADEGAPVVIERRGVRYRISREPRKKTPRRRRMPHVEIVDPDVANGRWSWEWSPRGISFRNRST